MADGEGLVRPRCGRSRASRVQVAQRGRAQVAHRDGAGEPRLLAGCSPRRRGRGRGSGPRLPRARVRADLRRPRRGGSRRTRRRRRSARSPAAARRDCASRSRRCPTASGRRRCRTGRRTSRRVARLRSRAVAASISALAAATVSASTSVRMVASISSRTDCGERLVDGAQPGDVVGAEVLHGSSPAPLH